jgi:hypothetical protein
MIWAANSEYYDSESIVCAIDDSPKHTMEYAKHGIKVASPVTPYNDELHGVENVMMFESKQELSDIVKQFSLPHIFNV